MKIALCAIGRQENRYAREWVEYYRQLGFAHIFIYDDNPDGTEKFTDVLKPEIDIGFVSVHEVPHDLMGRLAWAYNKCYQENNSQYDWMAFFDFDEFLHVDVQEGQIPAHALENFLDRVPARFNCVCVNWLCYGDNGHIRYEDKPVMERFLQPIVDPLVKSANEPWPLSCHVKSFIRTGVGNLKFTQPHCPVAPRLNCMNVLGQPIAQKPYTDVLVQSKLYLKHYITKSLEEYVTSKFQKGCVDEHMEVRRMTWRDNYWRMNQITQEKISYLKSLGEMGRGMLPAGYAENNGKGRVAAMALGRLGNHMWIVMAAKTFAKRTGREFVGLVHDYSDAHVGHTKAWHTPAPEFSSVMREVPFLEPDVVKDWYKIPWNRNDEGLPENVDAPDVVLDGYFQDSRLVDREEALRLFAPQPEVLQEIEDLYGDLSDYVSVNVRRGDFLAREQRIAGFRVLSKQEIEEILDIHFPNDKVIFTSDDIGWCKANFKGDRFKFADKPPKIWKPLVDLYLPTVCKACVISNSTFSWWGAFLSKRAQKIVYSSPWYFEPYLHLWPHCIPSSWVPFSDKSRLEYFTKHHPEVNTMDWKIWITYHDDCLVSDNDLKQDNNHFVYFPTHKTPELPNVNKLNPVWCELVAHYYVWKNKLYSKYVGFAHYCRCFRKIGYVRDDQAQVFEYIPVFTRNLYMQYVNQHCRSDIDLMLTILAEKYGRNNPYERHIKLSPKLSCRSMFFVTWNTFMALGDWLFPLIEEFSRRTGCGDSLDLWRQRAEHLCETECSDKRPAYQMRCIGFLGERLISAWLTTHKSFFTV